MLKCVKQSIITYIQLPFHLYTHTHTYVHTYMSTTESVLQTGSTSVSPSSSVNHNSSNVDIAINNPSCVVCIACGNATSSLVHKLLDSETGISYVIHITCLRRHHRFTSLTGENNNNTSSSSSSSPTTTTTTRVPTVPLYYIQHCLHPHKLARFVHTG